MRLLLVFLAVIVLAEGYAAYWDLPLCGLCQDLVGYLKGKLEGGVDDVQKIATQFCGEKAPILLQGACKSFVEDSMSRIVALLKEKVDVTKICTIIKMCKN
ncbi:unnamed protein product [Cylicocyclus nassatus]|uniref:Saposin B-type domain-containing protein n=1 Tax=Cylicocyclus nassatus TaxID=53992 RepID=A0AA36GJT2_CYLNA|nr:unnamed protein product [Cylicocyclus nassatus]